MKEKALQKIFPAFGTINTIMIYDSYDTTVAEHIKKRVLDLHQYFSIFEAKSDISRINNQAGKNYVPIQKDTFFLLSSALAYAWETHEAFDITSGAVSQLWRNAIRSSKMPSELEIIQCLSRKGISNLKLDKVNCMAFLSKEGQQIDLGGIAKGYAADEAKQILQEYNVQNACINFGGTVITIGKAQRVGIQNPFQKTGVSMANIVLRNKAIVTSGCYENCFFFDGKRYHHIIDPRTGKPSNSGLMSVTLIGNSAMELDALATGICVLGEKKGLELLKKHDMEAIFITDNGEVKITAGLQGQLSMNI